MTLTCAFCGLHDESIDVGDDAMFCPILNEIVDDETPACPAYVDEEHIYGYLSDIGTLDDDGSIILFDDSVDEDDIGYFNDWD